MMLVLGILMALAWVACNFFFLYQLVQISALKTKASKNKIFFMLMIKFPMLYLAGFYLLTWFRANA